MKQANFSANAEDAKLRVKDYNKLDNFIKEDDDDEEKSSTNIYESDDEEKNCTKTTFKNNSREEQLKLIPALDKSSIEMCKLKESCLSGQSEFETSREMGYQELEEKYLHYKKTAQ